MSEALRESESARRVATIDVGSNSVRLLVAELTPAGGHRIIDDERESTRLAAGLVKHGRLNSDAMESSVHAIAQMAGIARGYNAPVVRAVATAAVREAANGSEFCALVQQRAGITLEIISGEEEARLAWLSVQAAFDVRGRDLAVLDIGGGSAEIILAKDGAICSVVSLPLGAVRMTELFAAERDAGERLRRLRHHVRTTLRREVPRRGCAPAMLIGIGGTFTTLGAVDMARRHGAGVEAASLRGHEIQRAALRHLLLELSAFTPEQRRSVPGLPADRADIIVAGLSVIELVMKHLQVNVLQVHDRGVRDGVLIDQARRSGFASGDGPLNRVAAVRALAQHCRYEREHSEHVTTLALSIFDQIEAIGRRRRPKPEWRLLHDRRARACLEAGAILHDIGYLIRYERHHRHSEHLIMHGDLPGFTRDEIAIVALIARYHRRAHPKRRHAAFGALRSDDQRLVRELAGILRIADGFDRSHASRVQSVTVSSARGLMIFTADGTEDVAVDTWGAERKSELFAETFDVETRFRAAGIAAPLDAAPPARLRLASGPGAS